MRASTFLVAALLAMPAAAQGQDRLDFEPVGRFVEPLYATGAPGQPRRLFVVERRGVVRVVRRGRVLRRPFLDISDRVLLRSPDELEDQRGLLSIAFAPDYRRSRRLYVFFIDRRDRIRVDELRRSRSNRDRAARRVHRRLLTVERAGPVHHGGQLAFGPDGRLYASVGFTNDYAAAQQPVNPRGKILRFDVSRRRPSAEVFAGGLRNPYRFSFDRRTGRLVIADVGEDRAEELNLLPASARPGANFGWPVFEGDERLAEGDVPGYVAPALAHRHSDGWCSIIGGYFVRDRALGSLYGRYLYGDVCSGRLQAARLGGAAPTTSTLPPKFPYLVSFGEDARGRLYAISFNGDVARLVLRR